MSDLNLKFSLDQTEIEKVIRKIQSENKKIPNRYDRLKNGLPVTEDEYEKFEAILVKLRTDFYNLTDDEIFYGIEMAARYARWEDSPITKYLPETGQAVDLINKFLYVLTNRIPTHKRFL